jgi:hypothetical protein
MSIAVFAKPPVVTSFTSERKVSRISRSPAVYSPGVLTAVAAGRVDVGGWVAAAWVVGGAIVVVEGGWVVVGADDVPVVGGVAVSAVDAVVGVTTGGAAVLDTVAWRPAHAAIASTRINHVWGRSGRRWASPPMGER